MSDLQLGLLVIGGIVVVAVLAYNKWQEVKFRRQAENDFRSRHSDVLLGSTVGKSASAQPSDGFPTAEMRVEPTLQDSQAITATENPAHQLPAKPSGGKDSSGLSEIIDHIVEFQAPGDFSGNELIDAAVKYLGGTSKTVRLEGKVKDSSVWESIQHDQRYSCARAGLQLVDRRGAVGAEELRSFCDGVVSLSESLGAVAQPEGLEVALEQAAHIDKFCGDVDIQVAVHIAGSGFPGTKIRALAEAAGFTLDGDGRFRRRDEEGRVLYVMANDEATPFSSETMKALVSSSISLELDVPRSSGGARAFEQFCELARQFAGALGGSIVDDRRMRLSDASFEMIGEQLSAVRNSMEAYGIRAGGPLALRLFS